MLVVDVGNAGILAYRPPAPVELLCLEWLDLTGQFIIPRFWKPITFFPALKHLSLSKCSSDVCSDMLESWGPQNTPPIETLVLNQCGIQTFGVSLQRLLTRLPHLISLSVVSCKDNLNAACLLLAGGDRTLVGIGWSDPALTDTTFCPRLQHIDFSGSPHIVSAVIRRLVKSRLPLSAPDLQPSASFAAVSPPSMPDSARPLPIQSLVLDHCPNISNECLSWLQANVPRVSCVREESVDEKAGATGAV